MYKFSAFLTYRVRHDDSGFITLYSTNESKAYALIAACRFDNNSIFIDNSLFFRIADHVVRSSRFNGTAHIKTFKFNENSCGIFGYHVIELNYRRFTHSDIVKIS